jgi:hypothetical protein
MPSTPFGDPNPGRVRRRLSPVPCPLSPLILAAALAACPAADAGAGKEARGEQAGACRIEQREITLPEGMGETSGLARSRRTPGVFWTHNDSGGDPELFAFDAAGRLQGRVMVAGAEMRDWEDAAAGPCGGGSGDCLYVGDIGNNTGRKAELIVWRLPEPAPADTTSAPAERFTARFPDQERRPDAEAMFVLPDGQLYLITKGTRRDPVELYRWPTPLVVGRTATLERVRRLAPPPRQPGDEVTGASASPDGRWVAVRTYSTLVFYRAAELAAAGEPALSFDLLPLGESQGEAVALDADGAVMLTSEGGGNHIPGTASRLTCSLPGSE